MNLPFYVFAWIGCAAYASETLIGKMNSKYGMSSPWMFNFFWNLFITAGITVIALFNHTGLPVHWSYISATAVLYALAGMLFVLALYRLDVSVLTPLFSLRNALAVTFAALLVHEVLSLHQYALIGIIFIFGILASLDEKWSIKSFFTPGIFIALALMVVLALEGVFIKKAVAQTSYWETTLWVAILGQIFLLPTVLLFYKKLKTITLTQTSGTLLMALGGIVGNMATNKAYSQNVAITSTIISIPLSMVLVVIFSYFKPGILEKHTLKVYLVRFISAAVMITAALRLS